MNEKQLADLSRLGFDASHHHALLTNILDEGFNIHSILIERHGQTAVELYRRGRDKSVYSFFPHTTDFGPAVLHDTRSIGKSVISLLLGIAKQRWDNLHLTSPVIDFYPEYSDLASSKLKSITLEHLLTMSSGLKWNEGNHFPNDEHRLYWKRSPCRYVLSRPIIAPPGSKFNYNSGGTAVLADVLTRVTKTSLKDFARKALFEPLEITNWEWVADLYGHPMAFTGLRMSPPDMAKIGRLVLNRGEWQGRQIIASDWVINSLQPRINTEFNELQYGYHWWTGHVNWQGKSLAWAAAFGNGGQRMFIVPDLDMTMVITAGAYGNPQMASRIHRFFKDIISAIRS
jgi:CubicO group peptidase (beta-lactamase class C family)